MRFGMALFASAVCLLAAGKPTYEEVAALVRAHSPGLREALPAAVGEDNLKKGTGYIDQGPDFIWAVESASSPTL